MPAHQVGVRPPTPALEIAVGGRSATLLGPPADRRHRGRRSSSPLRRLQTRPARNMRSRPSSSACCLTTGSPARDAGHNAAVPRRSQPPPQSRSAIAHDPMKTRSMRSLRAACWALGPYIRARPNYFARAGSVSRAGSARCRDRHRIVCVVPEVTIGERSPSSSVTSRSRSAIVGGERGPGSTAVSSYFRAPAVGL